MQKARAAPFEQAAHSLGVCVATPQDCHSEPFAVILSIDSRGAALAEQKLRSSFELGCDLCEGSQGVDRQL